MLEIKEEMSKILANMKLPPKIHIIITEIYSEYQDSYKKLIKYLKNRYPDKEKEILKIGEDTLKDYDEDIQMIETIEFEEYEQRRAIIIESINNILKSMKENRNTPVQIFENNIAEIIKEKQNERFAKIVIETAVSEMESSSKYLINKINHLGIKTDEELEIIKQQFVEEIKLVKENVIKKSPEISEIISEHFKQLYEQLKNVINKYKAQIEQEKKKKATLELENNDEGR